MRALEALEGSHLALHGREEWLESSSTLEHHNEYTAFIFKETSEKKYCNCLKNEEEQMQLITHETMIH